VTCGLLPSGWSSQDIGSVSAGGESCFDTSTGTFAMRGSGADIWNSSDEFHFAYRELTGNGAVTVQVSELQDVDRWTKSGVMIRASLSPTSAHASMFVSPSMGVAFQRRVTAGGASTHTGASGAPPHWLRLVREGNVFTGYTSEDGSGWTPVGSDTIVMSPTVLVGIPLTSHSDGAVADVKVENVTVTTS
jgi:hypothetical protein